VSTQMITSRSLPQMTQAYAYDAVNRIVSVEEGSAWKQEFGYDQYGNRALLLSSTFNPTPSELTPTAAKPVAPWVLGQTLTTGPFQAATNRWAGQSYDGSGNLTGKLGSGSAVTSYDAENRLVKMTEVGGASGGKDIVYDYDGDGRRVRRVVCAASTNPCQASTANAVTTVFVYDAVGQLAAEYGGSTVAAGTKYLLSDALGSTRMVLDGAGTVERCLDYAPFGVEIGLDKNGRDACYGDPMYPAAGPDASSVKFTGKERDAETGLDYFGARYMSAAQGRFTSPDAPLIDQNPAEPQSWNLYGYVRNNPLGYVDPSGRACVPNNPSGSPSSDPKDYHDDDSGGQTCKESFSGPGGATTATAKKDVDNDVLFAGWWSGKLPRRIDYDADDPATIEMKNAYNTKLVIAAYKRAGCPSNFPLNVGHFSAAAESFDRAFVAPPGTPRQTQFQVGAHSGSITRSGEAVTYQIRNGMTNSSFWALNTISDTLGLGLRGKIDDPNGPDGPRHNVLQVFEWSGPNPCAGK